MSKLGQRLDAHFVACAAAAGASVAAVGVAEAQIIHSGPVNIVIPDNLDGIYMNIVTGATGSTGGSVSGWDINPYSATGPGTHFNLWGPTTTTWAELGGLFNLPFGTMIDPLSTFSRPGGGTNLAGQMNLNSDSNLLGFRFTHEGNGNQIHFGWIRMEFGAGVGTRAIVEYAYESTAGRGIGAGVVPTPGTVALLALGAAGLGGRRRK
ncbi:MAG: PEP-CTERM sorting domain-containing protein [Phycisphaeraceae bacterium]|nr:PEP-CTERM sorting domain-containing protein [Phycisphaeraceae bacterium]MCW5755367.1 PEP-CTERM sorting domain-containing protein [Phycisphaeraceae bacterium]